MKYVDEYRDKKLIGRMAEKIRGLVDDSRTYNIMEVCGTHTMNIFRFGLRDILPENINLISGPGCPVCVTTNSFIDRAIAISKLKGVIIATFGDMLKVPGSYSSLEKEKARGAAIKIVYSSTDALDIARKNPSKEVVFLGVGFETTAPTVAASIEIAKKDKIRNYSVLSAHKTMPEALEALINPSTALGIDPERRRRVKDNSMNIDYFLLPGHVSVIIGVKPYEFLSRRYGKRCVIAGFEPLDILEAINMLLSDDAPKICLEYGRFIERSGNKLALRAIDRVFEKTDAAWRGMGIIKMSGLKIRKKYSAFDSGLKFKVNIRPERNNAACMCGEVIKGVKRPTDCRLFGKACSPANPVGACMVSSEGACAAYYRYRVQEKKWKE